MFPVITVAVDYTTDSQLEYKTLLAGPTQPTNTAAATGTSGGQEQASAYCESELTKTLLLAAACCALQTQPTDCQSKYETSNTRLEKTIISPRRATKPAVQHSGSRW